MAKSQLCTTALLFLTVAVQSVAAFQMIPELVTRSYEMGEVLKTLGVPFPLLIPIVLGIAFMLACVMLFEALVPLLAGAVLLWLSLSFLRRRGIRAQEITYVGCVLGTIAVTCATFLALELSIAPYPPLDSLILRAPITLAIAAAIWVLLSPCLYCALIERYADTFCDGSVRESGM